MDTQNTPIHLKLWHRDFWLLSLAGMLLTMAVYTSFLLLPRMLEAEGMTPAETASVVVAYALGLFALGPFCSGLIERHRRNQVCMWAIVFVALTIYLQYCAFSWPLHHVQKVAVVALFRFLLGAVFGLSQMILSSTLIIDACESFQRTSANHSASWFARFSLSLGPMVGLVLCRISGGSWGLSFYASSAFALLALMLIRFVRFPFKTPDDNVPVVSLDRFFLPEGWLLFVHLLLMMSVVGMVLVQPLDSRFFALMMGGFLIALLSEKFIFANADLKSEALTGLLLLGAAVLLMWTRPQTHVLPPLLTGFSVGIIGSRYLLFFIKLSRHCQRGTSQSTFFLAWESGISIGVGVGCLLGMGGAPVLVPALVLILFNLAFYNYVVHPWYLSHKSR